MNTPEHWTWLLALSQHTAIKPVSLHAWMQQFERPPKNWSEALNLLSAVCPTLVPGTINIVQAEHLLCSALADGLSVVDYWNPQYPSRLKEIPSAPPLLFSRGGQAQWNAPRMGAIVGSRNASPEGKAFVQSLVQDLAEFNIVWVSGLALGIDGCLHQSALDTDQATWGVLAGDVRWVYPPGNQRLAQDIMRRADSLLLSERLGPQGFDPLAFKRRNRLIAGLADFVVLVESKDPSGSLITAQYAEAFDRRLFAVPHHPSHALAAGPNGLIQQQRALLCQQGSDIVQEMNWS